MGMTTVIFKKKREEIKTLESKLRDYKQKKRAYETLLLTDNLSDEEYEYANMKADYYQHAFTYTCIRLREIKTELHDNCNVDAFSYDSPCIMDDRYYEKKFKADGYLVGIRL